ncbi:MAG: hypothetical protein JW861_13535 [Bacteroidales bacterium]|nr:hypothetical protein [Bacteroidales bacterium]
MYKIEFTLKQHTPLIHFQHDQLGATLRATELKPKLDHFIISFCKMNNIPIMDEWKQVWEKDKKSLKYKIKIELYEGAGICWQECQGWGSFFGHMGTGNHNKFKMSFVEGSLKMIIHSYSKGLLDLINENICSFFSIGGFGNRQSKGYGFFFPEKSSDAFRNNNYYHTPYKKFFFTVSPTAKSDDWVETGKLLFNYIDLFYRSLRSGINIKDKFKFVKKDINDDGNDEILNTTESVFYFKSLLFKFLYEKRIQWDKKTIKEKLFNRQYYQRDADPREINAISRRISDIQNADKVYERGFDEQRNYHEKSELFKTVQQNGELYLWRDLFGLSTEESWRNYGKAKLIKTHAKEELPGTWIRRGNNENEFVKRFKSPIRFLPFYEKEKNCYTVYFEAEPIPEYFIKQRFIIQKDTRASLTLKIGNIKDINILFDWIIEKFDIEKHIEKKFKHHDNFDILRKIYSSLKKTNQ